MKTRRELKKEYKEFAFKQIFVKQFSTKRIDIINCLINYRAYAKTGTTGTEPVFSKFMSLYLRKNCQNLPIRYNAQFDK